MASKTKTKERLQRVETFLGVPDTDEGLPSHSLREVVNSLHEQVQTMNTMMQRLIEKQASDATPSPRTREVDSELSSLREEISILRKACSGESSSNGGGERVKLPEPKNFDGTRDAKTLENFIWDMEHYFKVSKRRDGSKVDIAALYLSGDAKLWY